MSETHTHVHLKRREFDRAVHVVRIKIFQEKSPKSQGHGISSTVEFEPSFRFQRNELGKLQKRLKELYIHEREGERSENALANERDQKYMMPFAITFYQLSN